MRERDKHTNNQRGKQLMNQFQRNRIDWVEKYKEGFTTIYDSDLYTRSEKLEQLNNSNIPTLRGQLGKWTIHNMYQVAHRYIK